jgi:tRNA-2-methylthio-N6-dimethylallyladenosine synthase
MDDDVPEAEKERRFQALEQLQASILEELNRAYLGRTVEVLVEGRHRERWKGRTRSNRLVFFESEHDLRGRLVPVEIEWCGPWSLVGRIASQPGGNVRPRLTETERYSKSPTIHAL